MRAPPRLYHIPEDEAKKSDDYIRRDTTSFASSLLFWRGPSRFRRRRVLSVALIITIVYFFWTYQPSVFQPVANGPHPRDFSRPPHIPPPPTPTKSPQGVPTKDTDAEPDISSNHYFNGPIRYYKLAVSLQAAAQYLGYKEQNQNVLFAAASLKSVSIMIPIACEMSRWRRNTVHFALFGRDEISFQDLMEVNGIGDDCGVTWHDARPDYAKYSTDLRMQASVAGALRHITNFMHPQVIVIDNSGEEEAYFTKGIKPKARSLLVPLIELPADAGENMMWMTRLDTGALIAWNKMDIDIIVHASPGTAGSLIRLLRSLSNADYFSSTPPKLTIELPLSIDRPTQEFLSEFVWPPFQTGEQQVNQLTLRHHINYKGNSAEESSIRFLESFYPANHATSHVLVISPQVEFSPLYYHYLKYAVLEYKYSSYGFQSFDNLLGIALDIPSIHLNGSASFTPPLIRSSPTAKIIPTEDVATPFLWQAPDSSAALYFGDKWAELHSFLTHRLVTLNKSSKSPKKVVGSGFPAWIEYFLELARARGYVMLYPNFESGESLATVHNDHTHYDAKPDKKPSGSMSETEKTSRPENNVLTAELSIPREPSLVFQNTLVRILPSDGDLPEIYSLPILSYDGWEISSNLLYTDAISYSEAFRSQIGGCREGSSRERNLGSADDLFCFDEDEQDIDGRRESETKTPTTDGEGKGGRKGSETKTPIVNDIDSLVPVLSVHHPLPTSTAKKSPRVSDIDSLIPDSLPEEPLLRPKTKKNPSTDTTVSEKGL